jgi:LysR family pca operon transcriptional activator
LHEIEEVLGVRLYDRHAKGVRETRYGAALADSARNILAELKQLDDTLDLLSRETSTIVSVGALPVAAVGIMPGVIARLNEAHPDFEVRLVQGLSEELIPLLSSGQLDLIVGRLYDSIAPDGLKREVLYHEPICLMARPDHPIFDPPGPTVERLSKVKLVLPTVATRLGQEIDQILVQIGIDLNFPIRSSSLGFIRELMHSGEFVAIMPRLTLAADLLRGSIRLSPLPVPTPSRPAGIIYRGDRALPPSATALIETLRTYTHDALVEGCAEAVEGCAEA